MEILKWRHGFHYQRYSKRITLEYKSWSDDILFSFHFRNPVKCTYYFYTYSYLFQKLVGWTHVLFVNIGIWIRWSIWGHSIGISSFSLLLLVSLISKSAQKQVGQEMFSGGSFLIFGFHTAWYCWRSLLTIWPQCIFQIPVIFVVRKGIKILTFSSLLFSMPKIWVQSLRSKTHC